MAQHIIHCRVCKQEFDTEKEEYVLVGKQSYYHKKCYDDWVSTINNPRKSGDADFYKEAVIDYLYRDVKMSIDFVKLNKQWDSFIKPERKMTPKGIFFAVKYHFEVQKGNVEKSLGGIGIVPHIYNDSKEYWSNLEARKEGTIEAIIAQIKERQERPVSIITKRKTEKKNKSKWSLDDI